jgi:putative ABC transport system substrate-binding protein
MLGNGDPIRYGLVTNLARPEANVTGVSFLVNEMAIKTLELLKEAAPRVERVAVFVNQMNPGAAPMLEDLGKAASRLGLRIHPVEVSTVEELDRALAALPRERVDALFLRPEAFIVLHRRRIIALATANRWPAVSPSATFLDAGALLSYARPLRRSTGRRRSTPTSSCGAPGRPTCRWRIRESSSSSSTSRRRRRWASPFRPPCCCARTA